MQISGMFQCTCLKQHAFAGVDRATLCSCGALLFPIMARQADAIKDTVVAIEGMPKDAQMFAREMSIRHAPNVEYDEEVGG